MNIKNLSIAAAAFLASGFIFTAPAETFAETKISATKASAESITSINGIVGIWREENVPAPKLLTINANGTYALLYGDGGVAHGTVKVTFSEMPDRAKIPWYSLYDSDGDFWTGFLKDRTISEQTELWSGQDSAAKFVRAPENAYHETSAGVKAEDYLGVWTSGRISAVIQKSDGGYEVNIRWAASPASGGGSHNEYEFVKGSGLRSEEKYSDGYGTFVLRDGVLTWLDGKESFDDSVALRKNSSN